MAERSKKALAATEKLYKKKPKASHEEFRKVAVKADPSVAKLSGLSFNASYVLPFKRSAAAKSGKKKAVKKVTHPKRGPGRPRKKRGPGRPRKKKVTRRGRPRKKIAAKKRGRPKMSTQQRVKRIVLKRDRELLAAAGNPAKAYDLAASVDEFVAQLIEKLRSST